MADDISRMEGLTRDPTKSVAGIIILGGVAFVLLPILPFIAIAALVVRYFGRDDAAGGATGAESIGHDVPGE